MFALLGDSEVKALGRATVVSEIEKRRARVTMTRVQRRNAEALYHRMDLAQLAELTPNFSWPSFFKGINHPEISVVTVDNPDFFKELNKDLTDVILGDWKTYLRWHLIAFAAPFLSSAFEQEDFNFNKVL